MRIIDATALPGFARKTAESASDFTSVVHSLIMDARDSYRPNCTTCVARPEMRAKHQPWPRFDAEAGSPAGQHQLSPMYVSRRHTANPAG